MGITAKTTTEVRAGPLHATVAQIGSVCTLSLSGELDLSNVKTVTDLLAAIESADSETIVIDLDGLRFIDSSGLAVLLTTHRRLQDGGTSKLRIVPSRAVEVKRILAVTGLDERLPFVANGQAPS